MLLIAELKDVRAGTGVRSVVSKWHSRAGGSDD